MAAPIASHVKLPDDAANAGKKVQTQSEVIGSDTVHAHFFVKRSQRKLLGIYHFAMALQSIVAAAHDGTTTGFAWLQVPAAAAVRARLRRLKMAFACVTETDMLTAPRVALARFTFTGTPSGATVAPALRRTGDAANVADLRSAVTGMTVTVGALAWTALTPVFALTTSGIGFSSPVEQVFEPNEEDDFLDLAAGEGALIYQPDAGTASDGRRLVITGTWDEYDNA